ncbi:AAA family ATPase [Pararhodobacter sp. SW119]|uniref:ExeA family protein n=1 Tax=Pararhodobacter sp. SW119 TaxID=2780075 RepID=UPI001ADF07B5|nr:AAA family ATPase [Pararhodobacter sp. SW119]
MYLDHFGMQEFPFRITPDPAFLYWTEDHYQAFDLLNGAAEGDRAVTTILGAPGTGKTTLLRHFVTQLPSDVDVGMISNYSSGLGGLGQWLHWAFNLRRDGPEEELRATFEAEMLARHDGGTRSLLIVDEAQNLSDTEIAELAALTLLPAPLGGAMRLVLSGQPGLRRRLAAAQVVDGLPFQIGPMSPPEVARYVRHRMSTAGCPHPVFDDAALGRIAHLTGGVPRLVNVFCELLLTAGFAGSSRRIDAALVEKVLLDVQQTGMLDHLLAQPGRAVAGRTRPIPSHKAPQPPSPPLPAPPPKTAPRAPTPEPIAFRVRANIDALPQPANVPAAPSRPPVTADRPAETARPVPPGGKARRALITSGLAAIAVAALVILLISTPGPSVSTLEQEATALASARQDPDAVGPPLPVPQAFQGATDAASLHEQALAIGAQEPLAAVIGFARAALRGDDRAAYYVGQHFDTGDGVPRSATLAAAWYTAAAETQRGARRALQNLTNDDAPPTATSPPVPLMGVAGAGGQAEFVWASADATPARYLLELADTPEARPEQHGPLDLSAALLDGARPAGVWRVVSLGPDGARISVSKWHAIARDVLAARP